MSSEVKRSDKTCPKKARLVNELLGLTAECDDDMRGLDTWNEEFIKWKKPPKKKSSSGTTKSKPSKKQSD